MRPASHTPSEKQKNYRENKNGYCWTIQSSSEYNLLLYGQVKNDDKWENRLFRSKIDRISRVFHRPPLCIQPRIAQQSHLPL